MEATYENIKSMIISQEKDGMMIKLKFQAEGQDTPLDTVAVVAPDQDEMMKNAMKQMGKAAVVNTGINMASKALGGLVGGVGGQALHAAGSAASSAASAKAMSMDNIMATDANDDKTQAAIVAAFANLSMYYKWDGERWQYQTPGA